ncbi:TetR/AcrR family transcriptional regulator [Streptomyces bambusae]|uniref:ScbR family autoregulator-binding transcription factor n=1 Tax=Streptomyces bambusae TaxID=1550616 RepID=UPI001CFEE525|nr:ScbR family autoregulator-binding transcription factor [Streptomyces bambusae]MCB5165613.1 TetR/AcrR family transcriptional regulator [Streptomyces bambusae]
MVKQERAARSRSSLVRAAAEQFDRDGYAGASLSRICRAAGISSGGLTFHFSSKEELARAVEEVGNAAVGTAVERIRTRRTPPLRRLVALTLELTRLVENDPAVRALVRLERERPGAPQWSDLWVPAARDLVRQARDEGRLRPSAHPETVAALAAHLVTGAEILARRQRDTGAPAPAEGSGELLERIWRLVLTGILAPAEDAEDVLVPDPADHAADGGPAPASPDGSASAAPANGTGPAGATTGGTGAAAFSAPRPGRGRRPDTTRKGRPAPTAAPGS